MRSVLTKLDFVRRYKMGEFGNASPTWDNLEDFVMSGYNGLIHIRNRVAGAETWYNVQAEKAADTWKKATELFSPSLLYISAMAPTAKTLFQGEVIQGLHGLDLLFTTIAKPMRDALREHSERVSGVVASILLRRFLCPKSQEWLEHLLTAYLHHAIEFSTYSVNWGTIPGYNTVFWEVRNY